MPNKHCHEQIVGLFPAGGLATRIGPLPCSKEIFPVGFHCEETGNPLRPKVAGQYLLEKMRLAGAEKAYIILRQGKWDILSYFLDGKVLDLPLAYLVMDSSAGVPFTLDQAYPFIRNAHVVFGFPDILLQPDDAFVLLLEKQAQSGADLVLGLFPAHQPQKVDMVELDSHGRITKISIKPLETNLCYTWLIAAWSPVFTQFLHDFVNGSKDDSQEKGALPEIFLGDVIRSAILNKMHLEKVIFENGKYLDIGTPEDMAKACQFMIFDQSSKEIP